MLGCVYLSYWYVVVANRSAILYILIVRGTLYWDVYNFLLDSLDWTVSFLNQHQVPLGMKMDNTVGCGDIEHPPPTDSDNTDTKSGPFLYCINLVRKKDDPTERRGASVKAMAVCSQYHFVEVFRALLIISLDEYYQSQDSAVLVNLYNTLNAVNMAEVPYPHPWTRRLMRRGASGSYTGTIPEEHLPEKWMHTIFFSLTESQCIQVPIPIFMSPDETLTSCTTLLFDVFGISTMKIYNALLTGARVLFIGYNHATGDVCKFVVAACAMVSPPCNGIIHRTFPYANLSDLSFLEVEGYIAGVTNPMFQAHPEWWDIMCQLDLPNGCVEVLCVVSLATTFIQVNSVCVALTMPASSPLLFTLQYWYDTDI